MADEKQAVESSATDSSDVLAGLTGPEYQDWKMTGKLPAPPKSVTADTEAPATSDTAKAPKSGVSVAAPEPAKEPSKESKPQEEETPEKRALGAERRIHQLTAQVRELQEQIEQTKKLPEKPPAAAEAAPEVHPQGIPKPKADDFETYEDFQEAVASWKEDVRIAVALKADREAHAKEGQEAEKKKRETELKTAWEGRVAEFSKAKPDFNDVALNAEVVKRFGQSPIIQGWIIASPEGPALLYHLASKPEELARIEALDAWDQSRELTKLEMQFAPSSTAPPPVKKLTSAPKPVTVLGAGATAPTDELGAAYAEGNFARMKAIEDERDLARFRSRKP